MGHRLLINFAAPVAMCIAVLPTSACMAYRMATPGHQVRTARSGGDGTKTSRRRAVIATVVGPLELAASAGAGYLTYRLAGGGVNHGSHAPQDRWSGMASDIGKHILGLLFMGMVAGALGVSGLGDLMCGLGELVSNRSCLAAPDKPARGPPGGLRFDTPPGRQGLVVSR